MYTRRAVWLLALPVLLAALLWALPPRNVYLPRSVDLLTATATDLAILLGAGKLSSSQLVDEYLTRIRTHDQNGLRLNSIISTTPDPRLHAIAARLDNERRRGIIRSPLHGLPVLIKDIYATEPSLGLATTGGAFAFSNLTTSHNAAVVDRLQDAGAIILGKANLDELNGLKGDNLGSGWSKLGGKMRSAYAFDTPCGSSGGSAIAVSAGLVPIALGSETAGSVTCPASHAALYSFVASNGVISNRGLLPASPQFDRPGIFAKSTVDLVSVFKIAAEPEDGLLASLLGSRREVSEDRKWSDFRIGLADPEFFGQAHGLYDDEYAELKVRGSG
jgi:amidase